MIHNTSYTLRLSIIVNMYNTVQYMDKCMESLLEQDIPTDEYEIILVDDCSLDNSLEMANEYAAKYPSVKVCHHEVNKGLASGRNTGVDAAKGKYLCFVDPDDFIEKNSLKALLDQMECENLDMLRFNYQKVDENYNPIADLPIEREFDYKPGIMTGKEFIQKRLGIACYVWAYIYRTAIIKGEKQDEVVRFIEGCRIDDSPWLPRVLEKAERVNCVNVRHHYYLQRQGSLVHAVRTRESMLKKFQGYFDLIDVMIRNMANACNEAQDWYKRFISYTAFSAMSDIVYLSKEDAMKAIEELKKRKCFPLTNITYKRSAWVKKMLMNFNPKLYWIIMLKK